MFKVTGWAAEYQGTDMVDGDPTYNDGLGHPHLVWTGVAWVRRSEWTWDAETEGWVRVA